jgi:hypothetical protein
MWFEDFKLFQLYAPCSGGGGGGEARICLSIENMENSEDILNVSFDELSIEG